MKRSIIVLAMLVGAAGMIAPAVAGIAATVTTSPTAVVTVVTVYDGSDVRVVVSGDANAVTITRYNFGSGDVLATPIGGQGTLPQLRTCNTGTEDIFIETCGAGCTGCTAASRLGPMDCVECQSPCCHKKIEAGEPG